MFKIKLFNKNEFDPSLSENDCFSSRKDLKQLKILESELLAEINNVEETITFTENKCTDITQRISEIVRLEKIENDKVTRTFLILYVVILLL